MIRPLRCLLAVFLAVVFVANTALAESHVEAGASPSGAKPSVQDSAEKKGGQLLDEAEQAAKQETAKAEQEKVKLEAEAKAAAEAMAAEQITPGLAGAFEPEYTRPLTPSGKPRVHKNGESLTAQASDPTAPLIQAQVTNFYAPSNRNADSYSNLLNFQPVFPVNPSELIPMHQVMRVTIPILTTAEPNRETGLGDISYFDIFVPGAEDWGIWGAGFTTVLPTASDDELGSGKFQLGPAFTAVYYKKQNWQIGTVVQNPISIAGEGSRDDVATLQIQPIINYLYGDWYFGAGDFNITWDWKEDEATIPVAFQAGKIVKIGKYKYNISAEAMWTAVYPDDTVVPRWGIRLGVVWLLPES
jgi:hypothetical protein